MGLIHISHQTFPRTLGIVGGFPETRYRYLKTTKESGRRRAQRPEVGGWGFWDVRCGRGDIGTQVDRDRVEKDRQ